MEVYPEGTSSKDPSPLKVKEVTVDDTRYIVCKNERQVRKNAASRQAILDSLQEKLKTAPKSLVGNKGYSRFLRIDKETLTIDENKVELDARFDGIWVLTTNTNLSAKAVALKYKELWMVEQTFRDMKSALDTRPIYHKEDETIRGHVFCSFLALTLKKELENRLVSQGLVYEWADIKQDLKALQEVLLEEQGTKVAVRTECVGVCGKVFKAIGVAVPPTIRIVGKLQKRFSKSFTVVPRPELRLVTACSTRIFKNQLSKMSIAVLVYAIVSHFKEQTPDIPWISQA